MPKSTGPLSEQLGFTSTQAPSSQSNMTDNTTSAADKLGANKATNAISQGVRSHYTIPPYTTSLTLPFIVYILIQSNRTHQSSHQQVLLESNSTPTAQSARLVRQ
jgi:hypothetical protein